MVGWYHWLSGHEFEQTLGDREGGTGKPGMLKSKGSQRGGHDRAIEQWQKRKMLYRVAGGLKRQDNEERDANEEATEKNSRWDG